MHKNLEATSATVTQLASANPNLAAGPSYASVAARNSQPTSSRPSSCVALDRGKPFSITRTNRIIIGPGEASKNRYPNSKATEEAVKKCINPAQFKLKIDKVSFGPQCSVIIEGDSLNPESLASCPALTQQGLEIKQHVKRKPRLVLHDIPVHLNTDEIITCLIEQNLPGVAEDEIMPVFLYPPGNKKFRSCIIETTPELRDRLRNLKRVTIDWMACRLDDHVSVLQCFHCHAFGHIASSCTVTETRCGKCAGEHLTNDCVPANTPKCTNCVAAKRTNVAHYSYDRAKCPLLRKRIDRQISFINYGP